MLDYFSDHIVHLIYFICLLAFPKLEQQYSDVSVAIFVELDRL